MQIVIDVDEDLYNHIKNSYIVQRGEQAGKSFMAVTYTAFANGIPLPKGHGRLIDADALIDTLGCSDRDVYVKACIEEDAPTILEADKEE